ncbi:hypothetical protein OESDEN_17490 [Oesophagostomum dentatum]|uniref:Uncharacterized protein n=1 Tax=Oesophagostomum dentatum TaxID=61180 RepID=A0A0B1SHY2_OESDE|nr:hypothetical protein OESDEN_17490 [Oesophagostomum dentatum]
MPVLGASAFILEYTDGSTVVRKSFRKWKEVVRDYFLPEKIRNYDLVAMNEASNKPKLASAGVRVKLL